MLDLVDKGSSWGEVVELAHQIEAAGASIINTGMWCAMGVVYYLYICIVIVYSMTLHEYIGIVYYSITSHRYIYSTY